MTVGRINAALTERRYRREELLRAFLEGRGAALKMRERFTGEMQ